MSTYSEWNDAIIEYFISRTPMGSKIYLSLNDDVLELIGNSWEIEPSHQSWTQDFCEAVKNEVVKGDRIDLESISYDENGYPKYVAFLGLMVLAATQMADDEEIDQTNYFRRLREIIGLPEDGQTRPIGLRVPPKDEAPEVQLWRKWNRWLLEQGFIPTAEEGQGPNLYVNYPISQTLLRNADRDRLIRLFSEKQWRLQWDEQTVFTKVANEYSKLSRHLKKLIDDRQRYEAVAEAIHNTYEQWLSDVYSTTQTGRNRTKQWSRQLYAGIYRTEDFLGNVEYYLYPKQQRRRLLNSLQIERNGEIYILQEDRLGWYLPIGTPLSSVEISEGKTYPITPDTQVDKLVLPNKDFWILVPDRDYPESGVYASWGAPKLGEPFIILFKDFIFSDLQRLRDENLIQWEGDRETRHEVFSGSRWYEIYNCQVVSQAWDGIFLNSFALKDALQPTTNISISLSGGLKVPKTNTWVINYPPEVTVFTFRPTVKLSVIDIKNNKTILDKRCSSNTPITINFSSLGNFIIRASCQGQFAQKLISTVNWNSIDFERTEVI